MSKIYTIFVVVLLSSNTILCLSLFEDGVAKLTDTTFDKSIDGDASLVFFYLGSAPVTRKIVPAINALSSMYGGLIQVAVVRVCCRFLVMLQMDCEESFEVCPRLKVENNRVWPYSEKDVSIASLESFVEGGYRDFDDVPLPKKSKPLTTIEPDNSPVRVLQPYDFEAVTTNGLRTLVEMYTPECIHCVRAAAAYRAMASKLSKRDVQITKVNCREWLGPCRRFNATVMPEFVVIDSGKYYRYEIPVANADSSKFDMIADVERFLLYGVNSSPGKTVPPVPQPLEVPEDVMHTISTISTLDELDDLFNGMDRFLVLAYRIGDIVRMPHILAEYDNWAEGHQGRISCVKVNCDKSPKLCSSLGLSRSQQTPIFGLFYDGKFYTISEGRFMLEDVELYLKERRFKTQTEFTLIQ